MNVIRGTESLMYLKDYLARIGYTGSPAVNYEMLAALHRAHLHAIPYENLNIHLGRYLRLDERAIFEKLVTARRGGWCYEMNTLLAWALREAGFSVKLLASAVDRPVRGDQAERNHLILLVELDRPYLADVGFGNGFLTPLPLEPGSYVQGFLSYQLSRERDRWFFQNHRFGGPGFDFTLEPRVLDDFREKNHELQTSPESGFVRVPVCHRFTPQGIISLRGAVFRTLTEQGAADLTIGDETTYRRILHEQFDLTLPKALISSLWARVRQSHLEWIRTQTGPAPRQV